MSAARGVTALPRNLALAYALLIAYACLHPFTGWRASGLPLLDFVTSPWPKYYQGIDLALNVLGYAPLGFLIAAALPASLSRTATLVWATLVATLLSFGMEVTQNLLPTRIASNLDLGANTLGGLLGGALGAAWGDRLFGASGWVFRWRARTIIPGHSGDLGLILVGLWLLTQLMPDTLLFASGNLRQLLGAGAPIAFSAERFILFEQVLVVLNLLAVGLFARCMMLRARAGPIILLLALGIGAKALASSSFFVPGAPLLWLTPGTQQGLLYGLPLLAGALLLPRLFQHALAGVALLAATTLTNLLPDNPYHLLDHRLVQQGNFLNFHGLTQLTANLWPFVALAYLSAIGLWRGEHLSPE